MRNPTASYYLLLPRSRLKLAEALPLIAVLWDLPTHPSDTKTIHECRRRSCGSDGHQSGFCGRSVADRDFQDGVVKRCEREPACRSGGKNQLYSAPQGAAETQTISKPDQLPAALVSALKEATHTTIEGQPAGVSNTSFANALFQSVTDHTAGSAALASLDTTKVASATNGSATVDTTKLDTAR